MTGTVTLAAPQHQDRRTLTVGASFGGQPSGRSLFDKEEPILITEPQPGQEFVFISASGQHPQANRAARVFPSTVQVVEAEHKAPTVLNEDGILVLEDQQKESTSFSDFTRGSRQVVLDQPAAEQSTDSPAAEPAEQPTAKENTPAESQPLTLSELLTGSSPILRPQDTLPVVVIAAQMEDEPVTDLTPKEEEETIHLVPLVAEQITAEDAVQPVLAVQEGGRQSKSVDADKKQEEHANLIPAETVSSRTVIKTAPNGQDYEYEYLYYDEGDAVAEGDNISKEPSLFEPDQSLAASGKPKQEKSSPKEQARPALPEDHVEDEHSQTHFRESTEEGERKVELSARPALAEDHTSDEHSETHLKDSVVAETEHNDEQAVARPALPEDHVADEHSQTHFRDSTEEQEQEQKERPLSRPRLPEDHVVDQHSQTHVLDSIEERQSDEEPKEGPVLVVPRPAFPEDHVEDQHSRTHFPDSSDEEHKDTVAQEKATSALSEEHVADEQDKAHSAADSIEDEKQQQRPLVEELSTESHEDKQPRPLVEELPAESHEEKQPVHETSTEAVEPVHIAETAFTVGAEDEKVTETTTSIPTTTEGRRRRPVQSEASTSRPRFRTTTVRAEEKTETRTRGKARLQSSNKPANSVDGGSSKAEDESSSSGRRRINSIRRGSSTTAAPDPLSSRQGLAGGNGFDFDEFFDLASTDAPVNTAGKASTEEVDDDNDDGGLSFKTMPSNSRFPSRFQDQEDDDSVQGRTPLRVVESSSFRNTNSGGGTSGEQVSVGRLTVLSGPARLPSPPASIDSEEDGKAPHIIQAEVVKAEDVPASEQLHSVELEDASKQEEDEQQHAAPAVSPSRPNGIDVLAFSRAVELEQQEHDSDHLTESPPTSVQDVIVEEVVEQEHASADVSKEDDHHSHEAKETDKDQQEKQEHHEDIDVHQKDSVAPAVKTTTTTSEPEHVPEVDATTPEPKIVVVPVATEDDVHNESNDEHHVELEENVATATETVSEEVAVTESSTTTTTTTEATTTTTTTAATTTTTTAPTTTEASTRGRGQSRFGANGGNFANRIKNRIRTDGTGNVGTTAPTPSASSTSAPAVKKPSFSRGSNALNNRLRRPGSTAAPETSATDEVDSTSAPVTSTTRRTINPNIRNRFNLRRGEQAVDSQQGTTPPTAALPAEPRTSRPRPSQQGAAVRVISPRPSILTRNRASTTTTTTTTAASVPNSTEDEQQSETTEVPEGSEETEQTTKSTTTSTTTEATTTSRAAGLNRLRNRISLAVSERPKPVRSQVTLNERRNRFQNLNAKKASGEESESSKVSNEDSSAATGSSHSTTSEAAASDELAEAESSAHPTAVVSSPIWLRSLRHNRRPGQLANTRRTLPSS